MLVLPTCNIPPIEWSILLIWVMRKYQGQLAALSGYNLPINNWRNNNIVSLPNTNFYVMYS